MCFGKEVDKSDLDCERKGESEIIINFGLVLSNVLINSDAEENSCEHIHKQTLPFEPVRFVRYPNLLATAYIYAGINCNNIQNGYRTYHCIKQVRINIRLYKVIFRVLNLFLMFTYQSVP